MFRNYLKIALRNLSRNKVYAFINIAGLSIGLACAMLILLYVKDESSFDRFHTNTAHIYRIYSQSSFQGDERMQSSTGLLQGPRFSANVPGIKAFVRLRSDNEDVKEGAEVVSTDFMYADSAFFSVFTFKMMAGDPRTCLTDPHSVVLTKDEAVKRFGTLDVLGKTIQIKQKGVFEPFKVTAVTANCPQNSSVQYKLLLPMNVPEADAKNDDNWFSYFLNTFVLLDDKVSPDLVAKNMTRFYLKDATTSFNAMVTRFNAKGVNMGTYGLQPFADIHTSTKMSADNGLKHASSPTYSYILSGIALFVLLIACINFVNLTVARSVKRAREIGIRKVVGSDRKQLIMQFLGESFLLCTVAFGMAVVLALAVLPVFNELANKQLSLSYLLDTRLVVSYLALFLVTGLMAGFYPALVLSGYSPVETLYSRFKLKGKNYLQKSLIVLQFTLASLLIVATITIYAQFMYLTKADLGYDDSDLILVNKGLKHREAADFKTALLRSPDITEVSGKNGGQWMTGARLANDSDMLFEYETVDEAFIPMMKIPVLQGRNFSPAYPSDSVSSVIVNEAFVKKAGWKNPLGQVVNFIYDNNRSYQVIGVVKDHHYASMSQEIKPQLFTMKDGNDFGSIYIKIKPNSASSALKYIHETYASWFPMTPYSYVFKNEENLKNYESEAKWKQIILFGAVLTIFISCIGMFGLSVLSAEKRTKEIGIRKVLGASVNSIVIILSRDFVKLVVLALLISFSFAWFIMNKWLENYPYRISLNGTIFAGAGLAVLFIAMFTVSFQAIRAAVAAPVKSLRTE